MLKLIFNDLSKEELIIYTNIAESLFHKNTDPDNDDTHLADESFSVVETIYKRLRRDNDIIIAKKQLASYYETQARKLANQKNYFRAISAMKKSCSLYAGANRNKVVELRLEMETWQTLSLKDLHPVTMQIDVKEIADAIDLVFNGLSLPESIVQFGQFANIYKIEEVAQQLSQERNEYLFVSMCKSVLLNDQGKSIQELPPISNTEDHGDSFRRHMIRYVAEKRRMFDSIPVKIAFQHLRRFGHISEDTLDFLVKDNAIIPDNRTEIIREGLCLGLNGSLYTAMHILLPQTENIFRHLVRMCGDTVTFLKEDGTEEYKPLSSLFKSEKLLECYNEDLIFTFQSIMDVPTGENLRNLNGHGLLEPDEGNGIGSLCFLSLLIMLLSLYSTKALSIRKKQFEQKSKETETVL